MEKLPGEPTCSYRRDGCVSDRGERVALCVWLEGQRGLSGVANTVSELSMLSTRCLVGDRPIVVSVFSILFIDILIYLPV